MKQGPDFSSVKFSCTDTDQAELIVNTGGIWLDGMVVNRKERITRQLVQAWFLCLVGWLFGFLVSKTHGSFNYLLSISILNMYTKKVIFIMTNFLKISFVT